MEREKLYILKFTKDEMFALKTYILQELLTLKKVKNNNVNLGKNVSTIEKSINDAKKILNFIDYSMRGEK